MKARTIFVVDDSPADRAAVRIAFERASPKVSLAFAESARAALELLRKPDGPCPQMMLVDVHMPGGSGLDLLAQLKSDDRLRGIPVFMLSGSLDSRDVSAAYRGHACGFVRKPEDLDGLKKLAEVMARLCVETLVYPEAEA
jgi:CheY-like chemotaxis protein